MPTPPRRLARLLRRPLAAGCAPVVGVGLAFGCSAVNPAAKPAAIAETLTGARAQVPTTARKPGGVQPALRVGPFVFLADAPLEAADPLFRELEDLPERVQRELRLPAGNTLVQVYLFESQERYEAYMRERYPSLAARRAYFVSDGKRGTATEELSVYTWMGEHLRTDLRHELTHAVLHTVLAGVPLWLDEGLAGFFEQPEANDGLNPDHLDKLRRGPFAPDLARLENMRNVADMERPEYREAWAWVHFCLRGDDRARAALHDYLQQLRANPAPGPLLPRLRAAVADPRASPGRTPGPAAAPGGAVGERPA